MFLPTLNRRADEAASSATYDSHPPPGVARETFLVSFAITQSLQLWDTDHKSFRVSYGQEPVFHSFS